MPRERKFHKYKAWHTADKIFKIEVEGRNKKEATKNAYRRLYGAGYTPTLKSIRLKKVC